MSGGTKSGGGHRKSTIPHLGESVDDSVLADRDWDDDEGRELSRDEVKRLHDALLVKRAEVKADLDRHQKEALEDSDNLPDEMDIATRQSEQAYTLRLADKEKKLLDEIDRALAKFERGSYGLCEGTGEPIGIKRLELRPWTRYSLEYKAQLEREKMGRGK